MDPNFLAGAIVILLFSVIVHEVMHGLAARHFGDRTAELAGRLTLNPIPHIDPIGTVVLPLLLLISGAPVLFGWAKPVPVNPSNFRGIRQGEFWVSIAGILSNFALAILAALFFRLILSFAGFNPMILNLLRFTVDINLILGIFNFLPIPPLDGSKVLMSFLPPHLAAQYQQLEKYGFLILMMLWLIPVGRTSLLFAITGIFLKFFHTILGV